jgi:hypothetical protein
MYQILQAAAEEEEVYQIEEEDKAANSKSMVDEAKTEPKIRTWKTKSRK